jgi:hypothetical protein
LDLDSITTDGRKLQEQNQLKGGMVKGGAGQRIRDSLGLTTMAPMTRKISSGFVEVRLPFCLLLFYFLSYAMPLLTLKTQLVIHKAPAIAPEV